MPRLVLICFCILCAAAGCGTANPSYDLNILHYATRNLFEAPANGIDDCVERSRLRDQGEEAWQALRQAHPEPAYSVHYHDGFVEGFADYLYAGGNGEPPISPPWKYRRVVYETPEGRRAVEDWFAGFRRGAHAARDSGIRELVLVPTATSAGGVGREPLVPPAAISASPPTPAEPAEPTLPPPRTMPGANP